jgi:hypothetical protein
LAAKNADAIDVTSRSRPGAREVFARQAREGVLYQGGLAIGAFAIAGVLFVLDTAVWLAWVLVYFGAFFVFGCAMNAVKYVHNTRPLPPGKEPVADEHEPSDEIMERLDLGDGRILKLEYSPALLKTHREFMEGLKDSLCARGPAFFEDFERYKADQARTYPKEAPQIADLQIDSLIVFRKKGKDCLVQVNFAGELGEVWRAEYENGRFSDLIW